METLCNEKKNVKLPEVHLGLHLDAVTFAFFFLLVGTCKSGSCVSF